ncbi:MAG: C40 family peptidase [Clostridiales bacterium]|nr:C40 family peptidase [Clostridiales bacterium]
MKKRRIKLAACLLAGAMVFGTGASPAIAADAAGSVLTSEAAGLTGSLTLAVGETQSAAGGSLMSDVQAAAEAAAEEESTAEADAEEENAGDTGGQEYANIGIAEVSDYVNIRSGASEDSEIVGRLENHAAAVVEGEENGWYKITSGSVSGYVRTEYLTVGDAELIESAKICTATVQTTSLRVRSGASLDSSVLTLVSEGTELEVIDDAAETEAAEDSDTGAADAEETEDTDGWVHILVSDREGYVSADYVTVEETFLYAKTQEEVSGGTAVVSYALQFVGNPYVWGGSSLTNGTDCSGFIMSVYAYFGVSLPHSSSALRGVGTEVSYSEAQPGDIICYDGHVALYIGNGQVVHAANESKGIIISSATHKSIITVRRIFS